MKITDYQVVEISGADYHIPMEQFIKPLILAGWEPQGGISFTQEGKRMQAMVKVDRSDEKLIGDQINDMHSSLVIDLPNFFQTWRDNQSYPRAVTVQG